MGDGEFADAFARIECHYFINQAFMNESNSILARTDKLKDIPGVVVHGRYDVICPLRSAVELCEKWPKAELHVIANAGHASSEPGTKAKLKEACKQFAGL
jgi:proline iminopeptidase